MFISIIYLSHTSSLSIPLWMDTGCFHILSSFFSVAVNIEVHISFQLIFFSGYIPRSRIAGSYGSSVLHVLGNLHTVLHNGCTKSLSMCLLRSFWANPRQLLIKTHGQTQGLLIFNGQRLCRRTPIPLPVLSAPPTLDRGCWWLL